MKKGNYKMTLLQERKSLVLDRIDLDAILEDMQNLHALYSLNKEQLRKLVYKKLGETPNKEKVFNSLYDTFTLALKTEKALY